MILPRTVIRAAVVAALFLCAGAPPFSLALAQTLAQAGDMQDVLSRLDRLQRELQTLQRQVYRGEPPPAAVGPAGRGTDIDARAAVNLELRLTQLENELRHLTGKVEELAHGRAQLQSRLDKLAQETEFRLSQLERGGAPAATAPGADRPPAQVVRPAAPPPGGATTDANRNLGTPPRDLGTVPRDAVVPGPQRAGLPAGTPQEQYDYAIGLLVRDQNLPEAEQALKAFIAANPSHALAANAHYWLGETYFTQKQYQQATLAYAEGYQKFPRSERAPETLLKLGVSFTHLNKLKEACAAYGQLLEAHPNAATSLRNRATREQRSLNCA
ncbi:MAG: tol-pal system protein YbgF [Alphaproteobacteria bacterium]|nr:tol-pal system protein YbgF [Alphaproteobacteria bacterium]